MRLNFVLHVAVAVVGFFSIVGCDKVATITGGPADGHDKPWYLLHHAEAAAEANYCKDKYMGASMTAEDAAKMPNFCSSALQAVDIYKKRLQRWAGNAATCKIDPENSAACSFAASGEKEIDVNSQEAKLMLDKIYALYKKTSL